MTDVSTDPDAPVVLELLRGVAGASRDPDVDLAELLVKLVEEGSPDRVDEILATLIRDARRD